MATLIYLGYYLWGAIIAVCIIALSNRKARKLFNKYLWTVNDNEENE